MTRPRRRRPEPIAFGGVFSLTLGVSVIGLVVLIILAIHWIEHAAIPPFGAD